MFLVLACTEELPKAPIDALLQAEKKACNPGHLSEAGKEATVPELNQEAKREVIIPDLLPGSKKEATVPEPPKRQRERFSSQSSF